MPRLVGVWITHQGAFNSLLTERGMLLMGRDFHMPEVEIGTITGTGTSLTSSWFQCCELCTATQVLSSAHG